MSSRSQIATIASHLSPFHAGDERLGVLLSISVGRLMLRAAKKPEDWGGNFPDDKIRHVTDWLKAALVNRAEWLNNVDGQGRPKKLLKHATFEALLAEVDHAMLIEAQKYGNIRIIEGDEVIHAELADGMALVRLLTPAALDRESAEMQHCIGNGGYDDLLRRNNHLFLSLRDRHGKAHATLEIRYGKIEQLQGKQNKPPLRKYVDKLIPFIKQHGYQVSVPTSHIGYVIDNNGDWYDFNHLPKGLSVGGSLDLGGTDITLPEGLTVGGNLDLRGASITVLPEGLTVGGHLDIRATDITVLPEGLTVGRSLDLRLTGITTLPNGLSVGGNLYLDKTGISVLPEGLSVGGSLHISNTSITVLPKGLSVGCHLNLRETHITVLPEGLTVGGYLDLCDTDITVLPRGLTVGRGLDLCGTGITDLPDSIMDDVPIYSDEGCFSAKYFRRRINASQSVQTSICQH